MKRASIISISLILVYSFASLCGSYQVGRVVETSQFLESVDNHIDVRISPSSDSATTDFDDHASLIKKPTISKNLYSWYS